MIRSSDRRGRRGGKAARSRRIGPPAAIAALLWPAALIPALGIAQPPDPAARSPVAGEAAPAGVSNPGRAWQNWTLNCQGCHRPDGTGSASTAPPLADTVARYLAVPGGREYLGRVPGVASSPLGNAELAEVLNWVFWRFDRQHLPADFAPYTAEEIGRLRLQPLRLEASQMHTALLEQAYEAAASRKIAEPARP